MNGIIVKVPKKGDLKDCENSQGVPLSPVGISFFQVHLQLESSINITEHREVSDFSIIPYNEYTDDQIYLMISSRILTHTSHLAANLPYSQSYTTVSLISHGGLKETCAVADVYYTSAWTLDFLAVVCIFLLEELALRTSDEGKFLCNLRLAPIASSAPLQVNKMGCWEPKVCCCCTPLKIGTLLLGSISLIFSGIDLVSVIAGAIINKEQVEPECTEVASRLDPNYIDPNILTVCTNIVWGTIATCIVLFTAIIILSILLLVGVKKNKPSLMIPYMVGQVIGIFIFGIPSLSPSLLGIIRGSIIGIVLGLVLFLIVVSLQVYFLLVVRAYYKELKQQIEDMNRIPGGEEEVMIKKI
ncbi:uncharacterized protein [Palaemon carinicauda]|uniref:uncharacterized protein n=1 Tax=Palaemon carinicauda TaxID=392227 RepID=UPI0035B5F8F3